MSEQIYEYKGLKFKIDLGFNPISFGYGYEGIVSALFPNIKWFFDREDGYQGDWFAVGTDGKDWFFHQGSFGSCSGCDMYEGTHSYEGAVYLIDLMSKITKIGETEQAIKYLKETRNNSWSDAKNVIDKLIEYVERS